MRKFLTLSVMSMFFYNSIGFASSDSRPQENAWHEKMKLKHLPKPGCFTASYPDELWTETVCAKSRFPARPRPPIRAPKANSAIAGTGVTSKSSAPLSGVTGSFQSVTGFTSVSSNPNDGVFSLQMNTNTFDDPLCSGVASCAWQQFVYWQDNANSGHIAIQYWLIGVTSCPDTTWTYYPGSSDTASGCFKNGANQASISYPVADFPLLQLSGFTNVNGSDEISLYYLNTISRAGNNEFSNLSSSWTIAQYNVFGYDTDGTTPDVAVFNSGTTVAVKLSTYVNNQAAPAKCYMDGFTAETNNLSLVGECCPSRTGIVITESNATSSRIPYCGSTDAAAW